MRRSVGSKSTMPLVVEMLAEATLALFLGLLAQTGSVDVEPLLRHVGSPVSSCARSRKPSAVPPCSCKGRGSWEPRIPAHRVMQIVSDPELRDCPVRTEQESLGDKLSHGPADLP